MRAYLFCLQLTNLLLLQTPLMEFVPNYMLSKAEVKEQHLIGQLELKDPDEDAGVDCTLKLGLPNNPPVIQAEPVLDSTGTHHQHRPNYIFTHSPYNGSTAPPLPPRQVIMNRYAVMLNQRGNVNYINSGVVGNMDPRSRVIPVNLAGMINFNGRLISNAITTFGFCSTPMIMPSMGRPSLVNIEKPYSPLLTPKDKEEDEVMKEYNVMIQSEIKEPVNNTSKCIKCHATETPMWRKGPDGSKSLCNACGLRFRKELKRKMEMEEANSKGSYMG